MKNAPLFRAAVFGAILAAGLAACQKQEGPVEKAGKAAGNAAEKVKDAVKPEGPVEKAGKSVDNAMEKTGEAIKEGAVKTEEAVKEGTAKAGEKLEQAGAAVKDAVTPDKK